MNIFRRFFLLFFLILLSIFSVVCVCICFFLSYSNACMHKLTSTEFVHYKPLQAYSAFVLFILSRYFLQQNKAMLWFRLCWLLVFSLCFFVLSIQLIIYLFLAFSSPRCGSKQCTISRGMCTCLSVLACLNNETKSIYTAHSSVRKNERSFGKRSFRLILLCYCSLFTKML